MLGVKIKAVEMTVGARITTIINALVAVVI
jgi:hypothetical protein